jgi:rSAM/selenodomain-associated transferase 2|tara:strand:- start:44638 stop:45327 length:690 start_codon:yes stop_codon:yes gene_type:complete
LKISFILPVLNEAALIRAQLRGLQSYRVEGHEIVLVDGGSSDDTVENAAGLADQIEISAPGRSAQMNRGAELARGDLLLFLHIDTSLPEQADQLISAEMNAGNQRRQWGWFDIRLSNPGLAYRIIAAAMNLRARWSAVCTGDQALFVEVELFHLLGGFPAIPLMEDVAMSKLLRRAARPAPIKTAALASSRRWQQHGLVKTVLLMWWLRLQYFLGVSPRVLVKQYYPRR